MTFPATPPQVRVDLLVGQDWTNITADTLARDTLRIVRGRADEASNFDASTMTISLKNRDGKYSPRNPTGPYFGQIGRNSLIRAGIGVPPIGKGTAGQTGTSIVAPSLAPEVAGHQFVVWATRPIANITLPGGFTAGIERDGNTSTWAAGDRAVASGATGTATATSSVSATHATALSFFLPGTIAIAERKTAMSTEGSFVESTSTVTAGQSMVYVIGWSTDPGNRMVAAPTDPSPTCRWVKVADTGPGGGPRIAAYVRTFTVSETIPIGMWGANYIAPDTYFASWLLSGATAWDQRFVGEASALPVAWDPSGNDVWSPVVVSGVSRRVAASNALVSSPIVAALTAHTNVVAYWPCEDGEGSKTFASPVAGCPVARYQGGPPKFATSTPCRGTNPLPTFTGAGFQGRIPAYTHTGGVVFGGLFAIPAAGLTAGTKLLVLTMPNAPIEQMIVEWASATAFTFKAVGPAGTDILNFDTDLTDGTNLGRTFLIYVLAVDQGADTNVFLSFTPVHEDDPDPAEDVASALVLGALMGPAAHLRSGIEGNGDLRLTNDATVGHLFFSNDATTLEAPFTFSEDFAAYNGHPGEDPEVRLVRLGQENGVPVYSSYFSTPVLGVQRIGTLAEVLAEYEETDQGILYEPRGLAGIAMRTRTTTTNTPVGATLSYTAGQIAPPFAPTEDDQQTANDVTCTRRGGSSHRHRVGTGRLSTLPPPAGAGRRELQFEAGPFTDFGLPGLAEWRAHLGTWDEARYPTIPVDLAAAPEVLAAVTALDIGDRVVLTGLPAWVPPGPYEAIVYGYTESIGHVAEWDVVLNAGPYGPYRALVVGSGTLGRIDSESSTLDSAATSGATTLAVRPAGQGTALWTQRGGDLPFDVDIAGERITVTNVSPDGTFETDAADWTATGGGVARSTAQTVRGTASGLLTVSGSPTTSSARTATAVRQPVVVGVAYLARMWVRTDAADSVTANIDWYTSGGASISSTSATFTTDAGVWREIVVRGTAPATAATAAFGPSLPGTPANGTLLYFDQAEFTGAQLFTVTRAVDGIVKAQSAGAQVALQTRTGLPL